MPNFGKRVVGDKAFLDAVKNEAGGGQHFGTRVRGAIPADNVTNAAKRASEFGPRTVVGASFQNTKGEKVDGLSIEELKNILVENPTFFDTLYEAELARDEGPRPDALRIFQVHEMGIKGGGRRDILDEINTLLDEEGDNSEGVRTAQRMDAQLQQHEAMQQRTEENRLLADAPRIRALKEREEDLKTVREGQSKSGAAQVPLTTEGQVQSITGETGTGARYANADEPAKPARNNRPETQQSVDGADTPKGTRKSTSKRSGSKSAK